MDPNAFPRLPPNRDDLSPMKTKLTLITTLALFWALSSMRAEITLTARNSFSDAAIAHGYFSDKFVFSTAESSRSSLSFRRWTSASSLATPDSTCGERPAWRT